MMDVLRGGKTIDRVMSRWTVGCVTRITAGEEKGRRKGGERRRNWRGEKELGERRKEEKKRKLKWYRSGTYRFVLQVYFRTKCSNVSFKL